MKHIKTIIGSGLVLSILATNLAFTTNVSAVGASSVSQYATYTVAISSNGSGITYLPQSGSDDDKFQMTEEEFGKEGQSYKITELPNGFVSIQADDGMYLSSKSEAGAKFNFVVPISGSQGNLPKNAQWKILKEPSGDYYIQSVNDHLYLSISSDNVLVADDFTIENPPIFKITNQEKKEDIYYGETINILGHDSNKAMTYVVGSTGLDQYPELQMKTLEEDMADQEFSIIKLDNGNLAIKYNYYDMYLKSTPREHQKFNSVSLVTKNNPNNLPADAQWTSVLVVGDSFYLKNVADGKVLTVSSDGIVVAAELGYSQHQVFDIKYKNRYNFDLDKPITMGIGEMDVTYIPSYIPTEVYEQYQIRKGEPGREDQAFSAYLLKNGNIAIGSALDNTYLTAVAPIHHKVTYLIPTSPFGGTPDNLSTSSQFQLVKAGEGKYYIKSVIYDKYMTISPDGIIVLDNLDNSKNQAFNIANVK